MAKGKLLSYSNPVSGKGEAWDGYYARIGRKTIEAAGPHRPRVADRTDVQPYLPHVAE